MRIGFLNEVCLCMSLKKATLSTPSTPERVRTPNFGCRIENETTPNHPKTTPETTPKLHPNWINGVVTRFFDFERKIDSTKNPKLQMAF